MGNSENDTNTDLQKIVDSRQYDDKIFTRWDLLLPQITSKIDEILDNQYNEPRDTLIVNALNPNYKQTIDSFARRLSTHLTSHFNRSPPFTIVRICELLTSPTKYYLHADKFLRALENIICVSSSIDDFPESVFKVENGETAFPNNEEVVPIAIGKDDVKTVLLTKLSWLTEEDKKEIYSDVYLMDEFALHNGPDSEDYDNEDEYPTTSGGESRMEETDSAALEEQMIEQKKRKAHDDYEDGHEDSIEKKYKADTSMEAEEDLENVSSPESADQPVQALSAVSKEATPEDGLMLSEEFIDNSKEAANGLTLLSKKADQKEDNMDVD